MQHLHYVVHKRLKHNEDFQKYYYLLKYSFAEAGVKNEVKKKTGIILSVCMDFSFFREKRIVEYRREGINFLFYDSEEAILITPTTLIKLLYPESTLRLRKFDGCYIDGNNSGEHELRAYKNFLPEIEDRKTRISDFVVEEVLFPGK